LPGANDREVDGFEVKRLGDVDCKAKIIIHLVQSRDRFKLAEPLAELLGMRVASRTEVVVALWEYIKVGCFIGKLTILSSHPSILVTQSS
jgi:chromatin remodeling complex protein RSC6